MNRCEPPFDNIVWFDLDSVHTQKQYRIYIRLPDDPDQKNLHILYLLDGQWDFPLLNTLLGGLKFEGAIEDMLLVGICYMGSEDEVQKNRVEDFVPIYTDDGQETGCASKFVKFIHEELAPILEADYPVDPRNSVLGGASLGGLFALYAMLSAPGVFRKFVVASPTMAHDDTHILKIEEEFSKTNRELDCRLYLTAGESEHITSRNLLQTFCETLDKRKYGKFKSHFSVIPGEGHVSLKPETFNRGLRYIQTLDHLALPVQELEKLQGDYKVHDSDLKMRIYVENGELHFHIPLINESPDKLLALTEDAFISKKFPVRVKFMKNNPSTNMECLLTCYSMEKRAIRI